MRTRKRMKRAQRKQLRNEVHWSIVDALRMTPRAKRRARRLFRAFEYVRRLAVREAGAT